MSENLTYKAIMDEKQETQESTENATDFDQLPTRQQLFILYYLSPECNFNGSKAYEKAYENYNNNACRTNASKLLAKPNIQKIIDEKITEILKDKEQLILKTVNEYKKIAFADISEFLEYGNGQAQIYPSTTVDTRPISSVKFNIKPMTINKRQSNNDENQDSVNDAIEDTQSKDVYILENIEFKMHDKIKALDGLAKYLNIVNSSIEVTGPDKSDLFESFKRNLSG